MPVIAVKAGGKVGVTFLLEEIVVVTLLAEVRHVVVLAVIADLLDHCTDGRLVFTDELGVLDLFALEDLREALFSGEGTLEFGNTAS